MAKTKTPLPTGPNACRLCSRWEGVRSVCMSGYGPSQPELVCIAEAPARTEDVWCRQCQRPYLASCVTDAHDIGQPLVGSSGMMLDDILVRVGINPANVYKTHIVRCAGGNPTMLHVRKCRSYLLNELLALDYSQCRGVMLLGQTAIRGVLNRGHLNVKQTRLRVLDPFGPDIDGKKIIPVPLRCTYHPAAILHADKNEALVEEVLGDFYELWKPREGVSPPQHIKSALELAQAFPEPAVIGLDLEWTKGGKLRVVGLSDGKTSVVVPTPEPVLDWLSDIGSQSRIREEKE